MKDNDRLPLSYIGQYYYCHRRAALMMNQQLWSDNEYTIEGGIEHQRVHTGRVERRGNLLRLYELAVWSDSLMLSGKCDCVEAIKSSDGAKLPSEEERYVLYPIEYKHGRVRNEKEYELQLCAQAMCLEEMYSTHINEGALFYIDAHQRVKIKLTEELRNLTIKTADELWECYRSQSLPPAEAGRKCSKCSLKEDCMPELGKTAGKYLENILSELREAEI